MLCVASSGIAALLLQGGRTAHSTFKIPIPCHESSVCNIKNNSALADLIRSADLIIWDEAPSHQENWKILFCTFLYFFAFIIKKAKKKLHILFLLNFQLV